jgi:catechol 2,3-dioxygenase
MAKRIDPRTQIGHVHLKVSDLERALAFYHGVLGFDITQRMGDSAAFLSAGGYHHHIGLNTWESRGGTAPSPGTTGLYHVAIRYPDRAALGDALRRLREARVPLDGASDHGVSEALYLHDPDGNGVELYWDRPKTEWPYAADGSIRMMTDPLDLRALLAAGSDRGQTGVKPGSDQSGAEAGAGQSGVRPGSNQGQTGVKPRSDSGASPDDAATASGYAPMSLDTRERLRALRLALLQLHKTLLEDTRASYELDRGRIPSNASLLQLVIHDPWFAWLHSISELIVRIDEAVEPDSPATTPDALALIDQVDRLLTASENGETFQRRYFEALQRQPAVVLAHAEVRRLLKNARP